MRSGHAAGDKLGKLRALYEPNRKALSDALYVPLPEWLPEPEAKDNWRKTARDVDCEPGGTG